MDEGGLVYSNAKPYSLDFVFFQRCLSKTTWSLWIETIIDVTFSCGAYLTKRQLDAYTYKCVLCSFLHLNEVEKNRMLPTTCRADPSHPVCQLASLFMPLSYAQDPFSYFAPEHPILPQKHSVLVIYVSQGPIRNVGPHTLPNISARARFDIPLENFHWWSSPYRESHA